MSKAPWYKALPQLSLCLLAFTIPLPYIYGAIATAILVLSWLVQLNFKSTYSNFKERKILWLWVAFFLLHVVSYFYSANKGQAAFDIESKLSIFLLPIIIGAGISITKKQLEQILLTFVVSISLVSLGCLIQAVVLWSQSGNIDVFFYHNLINGLEANAVYEAWYTIFSLGILLFHKWEHYWKGKGRYLKLAVILLQIIFFVLLSSRMLILLFFLVLIPFYGRKAVKNLSKLQITAALLAFLLFCSSIFIIDNPIKQRYQNLIEMDNNLPWRDDYTDVEEAEFSNLTLRLFVWRMGFKTVSEGSTWLTGTGNGDAQDVLNEQMASHGIRNMRTPGEWGLSPFHNANLHNMYMQALVMIGIGGLLLIFFIAFLPFFHLSKEQISNAFIIFHIASFLFFMQEAALQTQAGIIYYSFFGSIFWNMVYRKG